MLIKERIYYMDSMRAVLMILGILLHAANIFSPDHSWLVSSEDTNIIFSGISNFINVFRMPAFFIVSGFFFTYTYLNKQQIDITDRLCRLFVPLVFTALTFNVIQEVLVAHHQNRPMNFSEFFMEGGWVSHLWFLINLIIYNVVVWFLFRFQFFHISFEKISHFLAGNYTYILAIVIFPFLLLGIFGLNKVFNIYSTIFDVSSPFLLLFYFQFFVVGLLFGYSQRLLNRFSSPGKKELLAFFLAYFFSLYGKKILSDNSFFYDFFTVYNDSILIIFLASMCFFLFKRFLDYKNYLLSLISKSAYSIYLLHHFLVVTIGIIFVNLSVNIYVAYTIIVILTFLATMLAHKVISRSRGLSFLLNGIRPQGSKG